MTWLSSSNDRTPSKAETTKMAGALPTIYEKSQGGFGVFSPIAEVAGSLPSEDTERAVKKLIRNHVALAGTAGFAASAGGGRRCRFRFRPSRRGARFLAAGPVTPADACRRHRSEQWRSGPATGSVTTEGFVR
jgi:hypothetical protein